MSDSEDFLLTSGPEADLLETDIRSRSFNAAPWNKHAILDKNDPNKLWKSERLVLKTCDSENGDAPFSRLGIDDTTRLNAIEERSVCSLCERSRKYYCYSCCVPLAETEGIIPRIEGLPIRIDVIKHAKELEGKVIQLGSFLFHS